MRFGQTVFRNEKSYKIFTKNSCQQFGYQIDYRKFANSF